MLPQSGGFLHNVTDCEKKHEIFLKFWLTTKVLDPHMARQTGFAWERVADALVRQIKATFLFAKFAPRIRSTSQAITDKRVCALKIALYR